ncbi:clostripain-related cysteine peptidase [Candidatus Oscillochloris fontis]|uniref:clostripain-related cysteine peptidase n=1 Tax=Candidatus Oscillochloris fontis TaxID=2496868 RepID=UPI00101D45D2|nr:clostripain-related cysteine peptidase [Candidatus Oscillochloris fontis]
MIYTKTRNPPYTNDVDWVRWRPTIPATGQYQVFVYMPGYTHTTGITTKARYQIGSATGTTTVVLNQNSGTCGWVSLGWYQFNAGTSGSVYMGDYTGDNPFQLIAADGVKFVANQPPLVPTMLSPSDGATTSSTNVTLQAQDAGDPDNGPSNSRQFQFAIEQIGGSWSQTSGWGGNSWNITLPADGQYRWHVQANDGSSSTSGWSVWRSITLSRVYSISGRITTSSGAGLGSVSVSDGTRTATTNSTGDYTLSGVPAGNYTLTTSRSGYSFSPTTRSISVSGNLTGQNFTGTLLTYSVSGRITTSSGTAISGVTVSDGTRTATTNSTGDYTLSGVPAGSYTLTPTKSGYSFSPTTRSINVSGNLTDQGFTGTARARWTFMLYLDGDTQELDNGLVFGYFADAIQRLEVNPNDLVHVVALLDGTTTIDTFQVTFTPQAQYQPLGEKRMDDPLTLSAFVQQAQQEFPAEYYYLVIADHGNAIQGLAWDTTSANDKTALLTPGELRQALITITNDGAYPLDVVHFDACSFGLLETVAMARGMARYVVVSQNTAFASFPYERYRDAVGNNTTPQEFVRAITVAYAASISTPYTISALDMSQFEVVLSRLNTFADRLTAFANVSQANRDLLVSLRTQSQKFDSGGEPYLTITNDDKYIDLVDFATRTRTQVVTHDVPAAATTLIDAIQSFVIAEMHRSGIYAPDSYLSREWNLDGTHGISIYYPPRSAGSEFSDYIDGTTFPSFTSLSRWKNYLMVGAPPLAPGDPLPEDQIEPLAPLPVSPYNVYLPIVVR